MNQIVYKGHVFEHDDIDSGATVHLASSLRSSSLEANTLSAVLKNAGNLFHDFNRNDQIIWIRNGIRLGTFYLQEVSREGPGTYSVYATSAIGILSEGRHYGGIYTGQTAEEVIAEICTAVPYYIQQKYKNIKLYGWLPIDSPRNNLSKVLFAIGAWVKTDMDGFLRIESLWNGVISASDTDYMLEGASVVDESKVTSVVVTEHQYVKGGDETVLFEGTATEGEPIKFNAPMYDLSAEGFRIISSDVNYAYVSSGSGKLTGRAYIHNTRDITETIVENATEPNIKSVKDSTLISLVNSRAVATRLANYYKWTETIKSPMVYRGEAPGNRISTWNPYDEIRTTACLQSADISLSNLLVADEELLIGFVPPQIEEEEILENRVLLTGSGEWTAPADASGTARGVLISGGTGGSSGLKGADTEAQRTTSGSDTVTAAVTTYKYSYYTKPGDGGDPGTPGDGGKVFQFEFEITPGKTYRYTCGAGGEGGEPGDSSSPGSSGGVTTFEEYSSEQGSSAPGGFLDVVTGETYATTGDSGISGANGVGYDDDTLIPGGTITVDGVQYGPGNTGETIEKNEGNYSVGYGTKEATALGGLGGGAAYGANGNDGSDGDIARTTDSSATARGGRGGKGADALPPPDETTYGKGGTSGNGGGGAGSPGRARVANRRWKRGDDETSSMPQATLNLWVQASGEGGLGSKGGKGGPGCIVLYYSTSKKIGSGLLIDRNERGFVDKYGRYFVV